MTELESLQNEQAFLASYRMHAVASVADTARFLGSSVDVVYDAVARNDIASTRLGKKILILTRPLLVSLGEEP